MKKGQKTTTTKKKISNILFDIRQKSQYSQNYILKKHNIDIRTFKKHVYPFVETTPKHNRQGKDRYLISLKKKYIDILENYPIGYIDLLDSRSKEFINLLFWND